MSAVIRVAIAGPRGRMGQEAVKAVDDAPDLELVACLDRPSGATQSTVRTTAEDTVPVFADPIACFIEARPDVLVDFTCAQSAQTIVPQAVAAGVRPVIGTTGFSQAFLHELDRDLRQQEIGGLYAPNFAIGALLMMRASELAARYLSAVTIVEYHHESKRDAPSGTAQKTAQRIEQVHAQLTGQLAQVPIHSVRLSGFVAHQEVIFGGSDERLTIRHDSMSRKSFMPGVLLGIRSVMSATGLVDGLEHFLW